MALVTAPHPHPDAAPRASFRDLLPSWQRLRYLAWRAGLGGGRPILLRLSDGTRLVLRPPPTTDLDTAMEIFCCQVYQSPRPIEAGRVRRVVDLGSNVGYSLVYLARAFPEAKIEAYEPHPGHVRQIGLNLAANGLEGRVVLHAEAVGPQGGRALLRDEENRSALVGGGPGCFEVPVVDWLADAARGPIDFLKVDVEGAEYPILFDPRFAGLEVANLVVEWHQTPEHPAGGEEVAAHLVRLGYRVERGFEDEFEGIKSGLIWGYRG